MSSWLASVLASMRTPVGSLRALLLASCATAPLLGGPAWATDFSVANEAQLRSAINSASSGDRIVFQTDITLSADLPAVQTNVVIVGNNKALSGNNQFRGLFVGAFTGSTQVPVDVTIQDLTITDTMAQGGAGGTGSAGAGGGAGLGGALFVADKATVTVSNVTLTDNEAAGGSGGSGAGSNGAGGGGMGGNGGDGSGGAIGGGGGLGVGADGGVGGALNGQTGIATGASGGGSGASGSGGASGGGGGAGTDFDHQSGGGGIGGGSHHGDYGGNGGFGGGGGSGQIAGDGGFGGGGGVGFSVGGSGGFGGGGAGNSSGPFLFGGGGFGGGRGASSAEGSGGGGGLGAGGAIFVQQGGSLTLAGPLTVNGNTVTAGNGTFNGSAFGSGLFLQGDGTLTFAPGAGQMQTVADAIVDQTGSGGTGGNAGSYSLVKQGAGALLLSGNNAYSGGTTIQAGTLQVGDGGTLGSGSVSNNARLIFDRNDTFGVANAISGSGSLTKQGGGTLTLTGTNTYIGGTFLNGGTVSVSQDVNLGGAAGGLAFNGGALQTTASFSTARTITLEAAGGTFRPDVATALTVNGTIGGSGGLVMDGLGAVVLADTNTYSGGTTINDGTLTAAVTGALGHGPVAVDGGALAFVDDSSADNLLVAANGGAISFRNTSSAGSATIENFGASINFFDTATAGTATIDSNGAGISFNGSSTAANATITTSNGGAIGFYGSATAGTAAITNNFSGYTGFHGNTTADHATIINNADGLVDISGLIASGIGIGSLSGNGTVNLGSKALTLGGLNQDDSIGGVIQDGTGGIGGSLVKTGTGTLTLTGNNLYTGGTTVEDGTLRIGDGGTTGSIMGNVAIGSAGTFAFGRSDVSAFAGALTGNGSFDKLGGGTLLYDGNGSGFAGNTTIADGGLIVGSDTAHTGAVLGGSFDVEDGGILGGHGTIGSGGTSTVTIASGGTITPGNSIGTLKVDGDVTFAAGSTYEVEVDPEGTDSDLLHSTGTAWLNGGSVIHIGDTGAYRPSSTYTILTADSGVKGAFADVTSNFAFLDPTLGYDADNVLLHLIRNDIDFCMSGMTANQCATGTGAESTGSGSPIYNAIVGLSADQARAALDQLSGEIHASAKSALIEDSHFVRDAVNNRIRSAFGDATGTDIPVMAFGEGGLRPTLPDSIGPVAWGHAFGSWGSFNGDGNAAFTDTSTGGFLAGIDSSIASDIRFGFLAGYSHSSSDVGDRAASGNSDNYHLGLYAGGRWNALRLTGGLAYTLHDIETSRSLAFPGFSDGLDASYNAGTSQVFGEAGYRIDAGTVAFEPFANLAHVSLHTDSFTEDGGAAALHVHGGTTDTTFTTFGVHLSSAFMVGDMKAAAHGTLGWRHAFGDTTPLSTHAFAGSDAFDIAGGPIAGDAAVIDAGLDLDLTEAATFGVAYQGQFGSGVTQNGFKVDLSVRF